MEHRRADRRYDRRLEIEVKADGETFVTHTRNVSLGGVYLLSERAIRFGNKITMRFTVPTQAEAIEVEGEVRWVENLEDASNEIHGVGVQFGGLRARDVWALNKFFEKPAE